MALSTTCPSCGGILSRNAAVCPHCGWFVNAMELEQHHAYRQAELQQQQFEQPFRVLGALASQYAANRLTRSNTHPMFMALFLLMIAGGSLLVLSVLLFGTDNTTQPSKSPAIAPSQPDDNDAQDDKDAQSVDDVQALGIDEETYEEIDSKRSEVSTAAVELTVGELALINPDIHDSRTVEVVRLSRYKWISLPADFYAHFRNSGSASDRLDAVVIQKRFNAVKKYLMRLTEDGWVRVRTEQDELDERWELPQGRIVETRWRTELWARVRPEAEND